MFFVKKEDVLNYQVINPHYTEPLEPKNNLGFGQITNKVALDISKFNLDTYGRDAPNDESNSRLLNYFDEGGIYWMYETSEATRYLVVDDVGYFAFRKLK